MSETKTPDETRRALQLALEEHIAAISTCEGDCDVADCDGEEAAGLLMTWFIAYETVIPGQTGPEGETVYSGSYITSDSSPAQAVGVAEIMLGRLRQDLI